MSERIALRRVVEILEGDEELIVRLCEHGIVTEHEEGFEPREVARILVCRTLVRDLEVDPSALDIILRLREELLSARQQMALLATEVRRLRQQR